MNELEPELLRSRLSRARADSEAAGRGPTPPSSPGSATPAERGPFFLYVEGPRDRDILGTWATLVSPALSRALAPRTVILGGRQPARAVAHFRGEGGITAGARGICLLDRDVAGSRPGDERFEEPGLEVYTWGRRHIESYLVVAEAIRRCLRLPQHDTRVDRVLEIQLDGRAADERALSEIDAKRMFGDRGSLSQAFGRTILPSHIARAMRAADLHPEILEVLDRVRVGVGLPALQPAVVRKPSR